MPNKQAIFNSIPSNRTARAIRNLDGMYEGDTVPVAGTVGYEKGAMFNLTSATAGQSMNWINQGTFASSLFVPYGPVYGYGIPLFGTGTITASGGTSVSVDGGMTLLANTDLAFAGHIASDDDDTVKSVAIADDSNILTITNSAADAAGGAHSFLYGVMRNKCEPMMDIFAAGTQACTAAATAAITSTGVLATDVAFAGYQITDDTDTIEKTVCSANTVTVYHSATSSTGHTVGYCVLRPRGTFKPSHYIYAAGGPVATTADGVSVHTNAITVAGSLTTDIAFAWIETNGGTLTIARAQVAADGTLTVQFSADPSTTSKINYMLLRSY